MSGLYRRVITIKATDSPNVKLGLAQVAAGQVPTNKVIVPGVLPYQEYVNRRRMWDRVAQTIGLDAQFYEGAEVLLFPPEWLNRAERIADKLAGRVRQARTIGIDPAEGGDHTAMAVVDAYGLIELVAYKTPDTSVIPQQTIAMMRKHNVPADRVFFDRGGGGKEHADRLRALGYPVHTVAFGAVGEAELRRGGLVPLADRLSQREQRYAYRNRRAEMYWILHDLLDPNSETVVQQGWRGFALPRKYVKLRHQLAPIPLLRDQEGRLYLPPKHKPGPNSQVACLTDLIGHSPDEADALCLACFGLVRRAREVIAGVL